MKIMSENLGLWMARVILFLSLLFGVVTEGRCVAGIPRSHADSLAGRQVVYGGRVVTFSSVAADVIRRLSGDERYRGMSAEQAVASMILYPDEWKRVPVMKVKSRLLREKLGIKGSYAAMTDLFDSAGAYRLDPMLSAEKNPGERRALNSLDEKAGMMLLLWSGELFLPYDPDLILARGPGDSSDADTGLRALSDLRSRGEVVYNHFPSGKILFILLMVAALVGFAGQLTSCPLMRFGVVLQWVALLLALWQYGMIWWLGVDLPLGSMQDTLLLMVIVMLILLVSVSFVRSYAGALPLLRCCGWLACGSFALVAWLNRETPAVAELSPMLDSPWLGIHVSLMMISYGLLAVSSLAGLASLLTRDCKREDALLRISGILLWPGVVVLAAGIFTGAAWASEAWGRWWAWDPKETFALVSLIVYAIPLLPLFGGKLPRVGSKLARVRGQLKCRWRGIYLTFALLTILSTYFGVNYLPSLHSYLN